MSEDEEGPVRKDDEAVSETSETATTSEVPIPQEAEPSETPAAAESAPETEAEIVWKAAASDPEVAEPEPEPEPEPAAEAAAPEAPVPPPAPAAAGGQAALVKADLGKRVVAALIDFAVAFVVGLVPGVGQLLGAGYLVLRDGLELDFMSHRSLGKQVMKLHLESVDGQPLDLMTSVRRNWILGIGPLVPLLFVIPILGWVMLPFAFFAAIALGITELVLSLTDAEGRRLGDKWAGTMVVED